MKMPDWMGSDLGQAAIGGAAGGIVRWITLKSAWRDGIASIVAGSLCSVFLNPLALPALESVGLASIVVDEVSRVGVSGFLIGIAGVGLAGYILDLWGRVDKKGASQ